MIVGIDAQDAQLVAQVVELDPDVGAVFLREELCELFLDLSLLVEQRPDGRIEAGCTSCSGASNGRGGSGGSSRGRDDTAVAIEARCTALGRHGRISCC